MEMENNDDNISFEKEEENHLVKVQSELVFAEPLGEIEQPDDFENNLQVGRMSRINTEM
jgi:hypothetical protein